MLISMGIMYMYLLANTLCIISSGQMVTNASFNRLSRARQRSRFQSPPIPTSPWSLGTFSGRWQRNRLRTRTYIRTATRRHRNMLSRFMQFHRFNIRRLNSPYKTTTQIYTTTTHPTVLEKQLNLRTSANIDVNGTDNVANVDKRKTSMGGRTINHKQLTSLFGIPNNNNKNKDKIQVNGSNWMSGQSRRRTDSTNMIFKSSIAELKENHGKLGVDKKHPEQVNTTSEVSNGTTVDLLEADIKIIRAIPDPLKRQQALKDYVKQLINESGIVVNDFTSVQSVSKLEDLVETVINVTKRFEKSTKRDTKANVNDLFNKTGGNPGNINPLSFTKTTDHSNIMKANTSLQKKNNPDNILLNSISDFTRNLTAGRRNTTLSEIPVSNAIVTSSESASKTIVSNDLQKLPPAVVGNNHQVMNKGTVGSSKSTIPGSTVQLNSGKLSNGLQKMSSAAVGNNDRSMNKDTVGSSKSTISVSNVQLNSDKIRLTGKIIGMSIYGARTPTQPTTESATLAESKTMWRNGMSIYGEGKPQSAGLHVTTETLPRAPATSVAAAGVAGWADVNLNGMSIYGGRQPPPSSTTPSTATTSSTVSAASQVQTGNIESWQGSVMRGMSIFGSNDIQPPTVSTEKPTTTVSPKPALEPFGGSLGYWSHLLAGLLDMLCQLCKQRNMRSCIQRHCTNTRM